MTYYLNLFSPETWSAFHASGCKVTGFSRNQRTQAQRDLVPGDVFLCYLVGLGRWCGALKIESSVFIDETPLFKPSADPFVVRFHVTPLVVLDPEYAVPVREPEIWNRLSWTKDIAPGSVGWGANFQRSLRRLPDDDGEFLFQLLNAQHQNKRLYELTAKDRRALERAATVRTAAGELTVEIPDDEEEPESPAIHAPGETSTRESGSIRLTYHEN